MRKRLGFLGGGQLGFMTAMAARAAGHDVHALDPDPDAPIRMIASTFVNAPFADVDAVRVFASGCNAVTVERDDIPVAAVAMASLCTEMRPGPEVMANIGNKYLQKEWLVSHGFPTAEFRRLEGGSRPEVIDMPGFLKACEGGFDGRGVIALRDAADLDSAWPHIAGREVYYEPAVAYDSEISVLVARGSKGETAVYTPALNHHEDRILDWSLLGADLPPRVVAGARELARSIAEELRLVGVLTVEMFVTRGGELLVNELAPRPHNSYHGSERACITGQFEQCVRAVTGDPLGSEQLVMPTAIVNLLGDAWSSGEPQWERSLRIPGVRVHLYGKSNPRSRRKMGHISAVAKDANEALQNALHAREVATLPKYGPASFIPSKLQGEYERNR